MADEIEIKLKIDSHERVRQTLIELSARSKGMVFETNIFFDRPDSSLKMADSGLRIRLESTDDHPEPKKALLTFKGPARKSELHNRPSFDVTASPPDQAMGLLEALGFKRTISFEKRREAWLLEDCEIELDEVARLGLFVEIEGPSEEAVRKIQRRLALDQLPAVKPSYIAMIDRYIQEHPESGPDVKFN